MRCKLAAVIPAALTDDDAVNGYLDDFLAPYYFDDEDAFEDAEDVTDEARGEWECYRDLLAQGRLPDVGCATWQDYARRELGWRVAREADGDHAYAQANPNGLMDYHYDWHGTFGGRPTFGGTGRDRMGVREMSRLVRSGAYDCSDLDALVLGDGDFVEGDREAMADEVTRLADGSDLAGYDLIAVRYHV